jgi:NADP-dependent 3-hydroxy acid dehydrogenase YdfG
MDANFYGVVNVTRAALPIMRKQKGGCILQISSVGGRLGLCARTRRNRTNWGVSGSGATRRGLPMEGWREISVSTLFNAG